MKKMLSKDVIAKQFNNPIFKILLAAFVVADIILLFIDDFPMSLLLIIQFYPILTVSQIMSDKSKIDAIHSGSFSIKKMIVERPVEIGGTYRPHSIVFREHTLISSKVPIRHPYSLFGRTYGYGAELYVVSIFDNKGTTYIVFPCDKYEIDRTITLDDEK